MFQPEKFRDIFCQRLVEVQTEAAFLVFPDAIQPVKHHVAELHQSQQHGVDLQAIVVRDDQSVGHAELRHGVENAHVGVNAHVLVGDDRCHIGHLRYVQHNGYHGAIEHPIGGIHPFNWDYQPAVKKIQATDENGKSDNDRKD